LLLLLLLLLLSSSSSSFVLLTQYCSVDKIENEMGGACSAYGGEERRVQDFGWGDLRERGILGESGKDWRIILRWIFRTRGHH